GGFYRQYITSTNNLDKPAPTPPITYINLDFDRNRKTYMGIYRWVGAGLLYCRLLTIIVGETRPYVRRLKPQLHLPCLGATRDFKKKVDFKPDVM
ncbi:hypothetical protein QUB00_33775, partial [Microcoleus sp. F8_C2]